MTTSTGKSPKPAEIRRARIAAGLTQTAAAAVIFCSTRGWQDWESGARRLHPSMWRDWQNQIADRKSGRRVHSTTATNDKD